jgi:hypothetical protein
MSLKKNRATARFFFISSNEEFIRAAMGHTTPRKMDAWDTADLRFYSQILRVKNTIRILSQNARNIGVTLEKVQINL